jgi:hypothetical protein
VELDPGEPDPPPAHLDELGIGRSIDGSRRRHCLCSPDGNRRGCNIGADQADADGHQRAAGQ